MRQKIIGFALGTLLFWLFALCFTAEAQQAKKVARIGLLGGAAGPRNPSDLKAFRQGLRDLGYVEGQNIVIELRSPEGRPERLADLAADLVRLRVDIIVTGSTPATLAAKNATSTIPIVMANSSEPVGLGLITGLARPGGNVTGLTRLAPEIAGKRLELLKEAFPRISRVAVLWDPGNPSGAPAFKEIQAAADGLSVQLQSVEVRGPGDFDHAFTAITDKRASALLVLRDPVTIFQEARIVDFTLKSRLPVIFDGPESVEAGGLMSYGANDGDLYKRAAYFVDKILKGAKPGDLPVEQPTKFELIINLNTAKQIGVTIPPPVLYRADKVIK